MSPSYVIQMRPAAAFLTLIVTSTALLGSGSQAAPDATLVTSFLDQYFQGKRDEAVRQASALTDLGPFRLRFVQDTPRWIAGEPALAERRRAAAAAFLLEVTHARLESDWGRLSDLMEWMCVQLRTSGPATPFELAWDRASVALAGRARARLLLLGPSPLLPHQKPRTRAAAKPDDPKAPPRHLIHALERFPDDAPLRLARIVAWTWGRDQEAIRNVLMRIRPEFRIRPPQLEAVTALEPLFDDPVAGAEALVRAGLIHISVGDHPAALAAFERSEPRATDVATRYLSVFLAGRMFEAMDRREEAMQAYARALEIIPSAESAALALSSLQFAGADREAAVARVSRTFARTPVPDPARLLGYGSYMHWNELRDAMRAELTK